jgi:hypothetical protein
MKPQEILDALQWRYSVRIKPVKSKPKNPVFTYVGGGEDSPRVIVFMGIQKFVRGVATEVTNPQVMQKIVNNPSFVEGEVGEEDIHSYDEDARKEAQEQREKDKIKNAAFMKKYGGEK